MCAKINEELSTGEKHFLNTSWYLQMYVRTYIFKNPCNSYYKYVGERKSVDILTTEVMCEIW